MHSDFSFDLKSIFAASKNEDKMSKKNQAEDEVIVDIGGSYNKAEQFIENNKQTIHIESATASNVS